MARPCHPFHADLQPPGSCHWCDLYRTDAAYRALWDGTPPPKRQAACVHLGAFVPTHSPRHHHQCEAGRGVVKPCSDCGPKCPDYQPDTIP